MNVQHAAGFVLYTVVVLFAAQARHGGVSEM
jgi:hypothetical protein